MIWSDIENFTLNIYRIVGIILVDYSWSRTNGKGNIYIHEQREGAREKQRVCVHAYAYVWKTTEL